MMAFRFRARMTVAIVATVLAGVAQLAIPILIGDAVDQAQSLLVGADPSAARTALTYISVWLLAASIIRGLLTMTQNYQGEAVGHLLAHELRLEYYTKLQHLSFSYHDRVHTGELMTRGILDIEGTRMWVHTGILRAFLLVILLIGGAALRTQWILLASVALAFVPRNRSRYCSPRLRRLWFALQEQLGILTRLMEENLGGIRVVRAFASQELARFDTISNRGDHPSSDQDLRGQHSRSRFFSRWAWFYGVGSRAGAVTH